MMTFSRQHEKQLSNFPKLSNGKLESPSVNAFHGFVTVFQVFHGKLRGTHCETHMKCGLSSFPAFHPYGGDPYFGKRVHPAGFPHGFGKDNLFCQGLKRGALKLKMARQISWTKNTYNRTVWQRVENGTRELTPKEIDALTPRQRIDYHRMGGEIIE